MAIRKESAVTKISARGGASTHTVASGLEGHGEADGPTIGIDPRNAGGACPAPPPRPIFTPGHSPLTMETPSGVATSYPSCWARVRTGIELFGGRDQEAIDRRTFQQIEQRRIFPGIGPPHGRPSGFHGHNRVANGSDRGQGSGARGRKKRGWGWGLGIGEYLARFARLGRFAVGWGRVLASVRRR